MNDSTRPLWERLLLKLLYYVNGRAGFKQAFIRFFLPYYLASVTFKVLSKEFPRAFSELFIATVNLAFVPISFLALFVLWQCAGNLKSKKQFYLARAIIGFFLCSSLVLLLVGLGNNI